MPIDDLYSESTGAYLAGSNQVNVPVPQTQPSTSITSIARAAARGVGQGALNLGGAASDLFAGASQIFVDPDTLALNSNAQAQTDSQINDAIAKARAGHLFESRFGSAAYDLADTLKPDPTKSTAVDQVVQGAVSGLTQIVPAAVLGGPLAGAVVGGASIGLGRAEDLKRQGVDVGTRTAVGGVEGVLGGAGAVLPVAGSTIARTAGLVAVGGPGLGIAQGAAEKAILRNANYDHLADQIDPLDPTNLAASTLIAGVFGAAHTVGAARAAKADAAAVTAQTGNAQMPLTDMTIAARKALRYDSPQLDAYATQAAQAAGVPPQMLLFIKNQGERSNSNQVSPAGAKGVMQFTPDTWSAYGKGDPTDPVNSIDAAAAYAKDLLQRYNGDVRAAITEYNGGVKQAQAVHAGGAPTADETVAYLQRYDRFAANHQIDTAAFNPTPDQVDAALVSHGQQMVDDAYIFGTPDPSAMADHQEAFELAARQMGDGQMPDVTRYFTPDDEFRANALDALIGDAESFRTETAATAANLQDPGTIAQVRGELDTLRAARPDDSAAAVKELTRQIQDSGVKFKAAAAQAQKQIDGLVSEHEARVARLEKIISDNAEAQRASQSLPTLDSQIEQMRAHRATIDVPASRRTPIADFVSRIAKEQRRFASAEPRSVSDAANAIEPDAFARAAATPRDTASTQAATAEPTAVEQNVRDAAAANPDTQVHLDATGGQFEGKIGDALQLIDDEHAATIADSKLFQVAASCFISTGE